MHPLRASLFWLAASLLIALGLAPGLADLSALINASPDDSTIKWLILALVLTSCLPHILVLFTVAYASFPAQAHGPCVFRAPP